MTAPGSRADATHRTTVLVSAASAHGATAQIAQAIADTLTEEGLAVTVTPPEEVSGVDRYDAVIIGSAVYTGHWLSAARDLVNRHGSALADRPVWLFSSGPVGDPSGKMAQGMWKDPVDLPAIRTATRARGHQMFAGKLDRKALTRPQRATLLVFRGLCGDFRDWAAIRQWAAGIARQLTPVSR